MKRKSKIFVELETDAGGRKRYGLFSPWIFYLPSVNHPYKNERQQEILKLEGSLSPDYGKFKKEKLMINWIYGVRMPKELTFAPHDSLAF